MKILVVDDRPEERLLLRSYFEAQGWNVEEAEDGDKGLQTAALCSPDLVISDALMPNMDGFQFLREMKQRDSLRSIPFVFYTATYAGEKEADLALSLGAAAFLVKPQEPEDLCETLQKIVNQSECDKKEYAKREPLTEDAEFLQRYSHVVAAKLEEKVAELEKEVAKRKQTQEELQRLYHQVKAEAEISTSLLNTFQVLNSSLDERELIKTILDVAPNYLRFDRMGIFLYDEGIKGFVFSNGYGYSPSEIGMLLSRSFRAGDFPAMDRAVEGETVIIENTADSNIISKELVDTFGIGTLVIVPISSREKVLGGICSDYRTSKHVEERDILFLKGLSDGVAIALQNSRLYRESLEGLMKLSGKIETLKAMEELDRDILSMIDKTAILRTAAAMIARVIPCDRTSIVLREDDEFRVASEWGLGEFRDRTYAIKGGTIESLTRNANPLFLPDLSKDNSLYCRERNAIGIQSALMIPLSSKDGMIGFIGVGSTCQGKIEPSHLSTAENIASQISVALANARLYEELQQLLINTITSLAAAIDAKSPWTKGHSERVTRYALQIGQEMGLQEKDLERLKLSGLLHDVGKIGTYDILLDKPARLTDEEFAMVKRHPGKGAEILGPIKQLSDIIPGVRHHHERYDGKGYPDGLKGEEIPLQARILCVADSFDSMTADRPYRPSPGKEYAISEFRRCSGTQFDPKVVEVFLRVLERQ